MKRRRSVVVESPFAGPDQEAIERNQTYARFCLHDCLVNHGEAPFASHLLYTQPNVLRDDVPEERELGIQAGLEWAMHADATVIYTDLGESPGMVRGREFAESVGREVVERTLPSNLWIRFKEQVGTSNPNSVND